MAAIAQAADVATSTVSKALRDDPTIPISRRKEIQRIAAELGYRPNPMVAALMARLHGNRRRNDPHHIAWLDLWPDEREAAGASDFKLMLRGAPERAAELGYQIEAHHVARDGISAARLHQILTSRSQWGVIIPPVPLEVMAYPLDLQGLAAVTIGTSLHRPVMHRVASNLYQGCLLACAKLREKGLRRIGLVLSPRMIERVEGRWLGAYVVDQARQPSKDRLPPLLITQARQDEFKSWFRRYKPEAILIAEAHVEEWLAAAHRNQSPPLVVWLRRLEGMKRNVMAIDTRPDKMGAAAVELVVGQIHRNERGSPPIPHTLLLDGVWESGPQI
ncbi:MAG TPA: LacI family DNA-binding transcriptional regulator [Verrucomicrobiae bacterium]|nr:LacI family DNA-binding transcriptional regulator [Verrucomicrobiae bacterium]